MLVSLNYSSGKPVYFQIVEQVRAAIASGALRPRDALPSIRQLAESLRVNRNTVAKAYSELEVQGIIHTQPGKGCVVTDAASPLRKPVREKMLIAEIDAAIVQAHHLQFTHEEFLELVKERLQHFNPEIQFAEEKEQIA